MMPAQTRELSLLEALSGTATGFVISLLLQRLLFPALGHDLVLSENLLVSTVFTLASVGRSYAIRRLFVALGGIRR
jgi:hypothetical protein